MKKIIIFFFSLILVCLILNIYYIDNKKNILENNKDSQIINSNTITMMYETEAGSGEYEVVDYTAWPQEGYVFNTELSKCENGSKLIWNNENKKIILQTNISDRCYVYFDVYTIPLITDVCTAGSNLASCLAEFNTLAGDGVSGLYYHDGVGSYTNADQEAGDNSYRYSGANPNNYVCFGNDALTCPDEFLYRIIGVFDGQIKLIKNSYYGKSRWGGSVNTITWSNSLLNKDILNGSYLNSFNSSWQNKISTAIWYVGGFSQYYNPPKVIYGYEVGGDRFDTIYESKIGLVYVSDYGYAAGPENWTKYMGYDANNGYDTAISNNWMYLGDYEWTISNARGAGYPLSITSYGYISDGVHNSSEINYRPCFYLNADVELESGIGTKSDPYRIDA